MVLSENQKQWEAAMPTMKNTYSGHEKVLSAILAGWMGLQLLTACGGSPGNNSAAKTPTAGMEKTPATTLVNYNKVMNALGARVLALCGPVPIIPGRQGHEVLGCVFQTSDPKLIDTVAMERKSGSKDAVDTTGIIITQAEAEMPSTPQVQNAWEDAMFQENGQPEQPVPWTALLKNLHNGNGVYEPGNETPVHATGITYTGTPDDLMANCISVAEDSLSVLEKNHSQPVPLLPVPGGIDAGPAIVLQFPEAAEQRAAAA